MKNPTHPDSSPIRVETAGGWTTDYKNYTSGKPRKPRGHIMGAVVVPRSEVQADPALQDAIDKDLRLRNIKTQNQ